ncbi:MAG: ATP synthase F1 subunit delta [Candidatus Saccharicenans sp.]|nr:MAG: ATP synthase F1 subunit delta [Candidatus Aminicenantes bacterium]HEK85072.1 ATP synthase F1 subunit delta [Candidatus Aminicenantes bacterium]
MNHQSLTKKYALGLVRALKTEPEFKVCLEQLQTLSAFMAEEEKINFALTSPFIPNSQKRKLLDDILPRLNFDPRVSNLLKILVENERMVWLKEIVSILPDIWYEQQGIETLEVNSAVELKDEEKLELKEELERLERKPVRLIFKLNPEIIGGLLIKKGNIYYDVSIKGNLLKMKEIISTR